MQKISNYFSLKVVRGSRRASEVGRVRPWRAAGAAGAPLPSPKRSGIEHEETEKTENERKGKARGSECILPMGENSKISSSEHKSIRENLCNLWSNSFACLLGFVFFRSFAADPIGLSSQTLPHPRLARDGLALPFPAVRQEPSAVAEGYGGQAHYPFPVLAIVLKMLYESTRAMEIPNRRGGGNNPARKDDAASLVATRATLVEKLRDWKHDIAWEEFFNIYSPLIRRQALRAGLTETEAQDTVQETIFAVAKQIPAYRYEPKTHSFKEWLFRLSAWKIVDQFRLRPPTAPMRPADDASPETAAIEEIPDSHDDPAAAWSDKDWNETVLATAIQNTIQKVAPKDYQIFDLCVFKGWEPKKIAVVFQIPRAKVYLVRFSRKTSAEKRVNGLKKAARVKRSPPTSGSSGSCPCPFCGLPATRSATG